MKEITHQLQEYKNSFKIKKMENMELWMEMENSSTNHNIMILMFQER